MEPVRRSVSFLFFLFFSAIWNYVFKCFFYILVLKYNLQWHGGRFLALRNVTNWSCFLLFSLNFFFLNVISLKLSYLPYLTKWFTESGEIQTNMFSQPLVQAKKFGYHLLSLKKLCLIFIIPCQFPFHPFYSYWPGLIVNAFHL